MIFSSILFLFRFLPLVLLLYFISPRKLRNGILFLVSLVFYAWGEPVYVVLMLFSTVVDYTHGLLVERFIEGGKRNRAKWVVASAMIINLSLLGVFKYADFAIESINTIFDTTIPLLKLGLPIGISFYTFQTMSYTIDVYRGAAKAQRNIIDFGAYIALFPQLIAGPIVQYKTVADQLKHRRETMDSFAYGALRFVIGLGKKVLLANNIGLLWDTISSIPDMQLTVVAAWLGAAAYAFQIYFDFSGYSDMAIGLGKMFGFTFLENFNYPYESKSITEFWRRWHISLGSWFREYVYIPLGGNRKGLANHLRNILIVWLLTGLWHGASWNFVVWGGYFAVLLVLEKLFLYKWLQKLPNWIGHVYTMFFVLISWVIFAFDQFTQGIRYIKTMLGLGNASFCNNETLYLLTSYYVILLILVVSCTSVPKRYAVRVSSYLNQQKTGIVVNALLKNIYMIMVLVIVVAFLVDASYNPFLYFRF